MFPGRDHALLPVYLDTWAGRVVISDRFSFSPSPAIVKGMWAGAGKHRWGQLTAPQGLSLSLRALYRFSG